MRKPQTRADFISILDKELVSFGVADRNEIIADFELHFDDSIALGLSEAEICDKLGDISEIAAQYGDDYIHPAVAANPAKAFQKPNEVRIPDAPVIPVVLPAAPTPVRNENPLVLDTFTEIEDVIANAPVHPEAVVPQISEPQPEDACEDDKVKIPEAAAENTSRQSFKKDIQFNFNFAGLIKVLIVDFLILSWALPSLFSIFLSLPLVSLSLIVSGVGVTFGGVFPFNLGFSSPFSPVSNLFLGIAMLALGGLTVILSMKLISFAVKIARGIINWHGMSIIGRKIFVKK